MKVQIQFLSYYKDIAGAGSVAMELPAEATVTTLLAELRGRYPRLPTAVERVMPLVNAQRAAPEQILHDGDRVMIFPVVGGG